MESIKYSINLETDNKIKVAEFATILGITQKTVYRMIDRGELDTCQDIVNNRSITYVIIDNIKNLSDK